MSPIRPAAPSRAVGAHASRAHNLRILHKTYRERKGKSSPKLKAQARRAEIARGIPARLTPEVSAAVFAVDQAGRPLSPRELRTLAPELAALDPGRLWILLDSLERSRIFRQVQGLYGFPEQFEEAEDAR